MSERCERRAAASRVLSRVGSRGTRGSSKYQIREELAKPAAGNLELTIARGTVQPAEIDQQRDFGPRFCSFRSETYVAQNAGHMRGAFYLDAGNSRGHA